jgi:hypothetical protein
MATSSASPRSPLRFCLLVFALSLPFRLAGAIAERRGFQPGFPMNLPVSALMAVCPLVAAVILVHRAEGSAGIKRLLRRVLDYRRMWPLPDPQVSLAAAPLLLLVFLPPAVGEEAGWMGSAADPLQDRWGALRAGVLLGTVGALWHVVPLVQAHHDMAWIAWKCLETLAARVLIVTTLAGEASATLWRNQVAPRGLLQMLRTGPYWTRLGCGRRCWCASPSTTPRPLRR